MNNEYILKRIEKDRPFKTEKECIEYYMDKCWLKQDVASDLFYYKVIIDKALELLDSYKLGKYDYALTPAGLLELEDILRGEDNESN